ncbi:hypothetical protein Pmani_012961 [Petrolisthes manimaculis]|uniref:Uncharacterized protein n=1 Tax=Petrolisthes manimaculis TaxID=1843537 RepID=A0AAE1PWU8_9EUCA|nr:hypothetical protein Pmani_012961 [Petrolisthes manimaculis]
MTVCTAAGFIHLGWLGCYGDRYMCGLLVATSEYKSKDSVTEKELSHHGSNPKNNSQVVSVLGRQSSTQEEAFTEEKTKIEMAVLFADIISTSRSDSKGEETTDGDIQVVTELWEEDSNKNNITRKSHSNRIINKHSNTSKDNAQDAQDYEEGRNKGETIGQEVGVGGGERGERREQEGSGKGKEESEGYEQNIEGKEQSSVDGRKERDKRKQKVQSCEGIEEREGSSVGRDEDKAHEERGVSDGGHAGEKEKNIQKPAKHDGGEKMGTASRGHAGVVGARGSIREKIGKVEATGDGEDVREKEKHARKGWTDWFVEGKTVDVIVSPVLTWSPQPTPDTFPPPEQGTHGNLTLQLHAGSETLIIDLHPTRDLLAATYRDPVVGTTKGGGPAVCEYQGDVRGLDGSWVALSLCPVIRGMVVGGAGAVWVEPGSGSRTVGDPHRVYTPDLRHGVHQACGVSEEDIHSDIHSNFLQAVKHNRVRRWGLQGGTSAWNTKTTRFVELVLVADNSFHKAHGDKATSRCKSIVNVVNAVYRQLGVVVVLTHLEIWKSSDKMNVTNISGVTLDNFSKYRRKFITDHPDIPNDNMQFLTVVDFEENTVGKAPINGICSYNSSVGVVQDNPSYPGVVSTAWTVAHELGHNLGLNHDTDSECPSKQCIMMPETGGRHADVLWSKRSELNLTQNIESFAFDCLRNEPLSLVGGCGDGVLGDGEECDCGPAHFCKDHLCCNPETCKLIHNATCGTGSCCDLKTCKPKVASALCREARSECDIPEYCVGGSEFCPPDLSVSDGTYCDESKGHCYGGWCGSRDQRCQSVWGESGQSADPKSCYSHYNVMGKPFGNCGRSYSDPTKYHPCEKEDAMCGTLHCELDGSDVKLKFPNVIWMDITGKGTCYVVIASFSYATSHWLVPDGAPCGSGKYCVEQRCVSTPVSGWLIGFWIFVVVSIILVFLFWDHIRWWWEHRGRTCLSPHIPPCAACMDACCCPCMTRINRMLASVLPSIGPVCKDTKQQPKPPVSEANGTVTMHHDQTVGLDATTEPWGDNWPKDDVVIHVPNKITNSFNLHHPPANGIIANEQPLPFSNSLLNSCDSWPIADRNSADSSSDRLSQLSESHSEKGLLDHSKPGEIERYRDVSFPSDTSPRLQPIRRAPAPPTKGLQDTEEREQADETETDLETERYEDAGEVNFRKETVIPDQGHLQRPMIPPRPQELLPRQEQLPATPEIPPRPEIVLPLRPDVVLPSRQKPDVPPRP